MDARRYSSCISTAQRMDYRSKEWIASLPSGSTHSSMDSPTIVTIHPISSLDSSMGKNLKVRVEIPLEPTNFGQ